MGSSAVLDITDFGVQEHVAPAHSLTGEKNGAFGAPAESGIWRLPEPDLEAPPALHIDMLSLSQLHPGAPDWGKSRLIEVDLQTDELLWTNTRSDWLEGSFDTRIMIRSAGGRVEVKGNPSKWLRPDAVSCGARSMADAVAVFNFILRFLGLPEFTAPKRCVMVSDHAGVESVQAGAVIHEVHIAGVRLLGGPAEVGCYMDWLSTQRYGRKGNPLERQKGGRSVRGGHKRGVELACYDKAEEVLERAKEWKRKRNPRGNEQDRAYTYLMALSERLKVIGAVREEYRIHGQSLKRANLKEVAQWRKETMHELWQAHALKVAEVGGVVDWNVEAKQRLLALGLTERVAMARLDVLSGWMSGRNPSEGRSKATFYRIAADLRHALGVDIRSAPNVVTLGSKAQQLARPVTARYLTELDAEALYHGLPDWKGAA